MIKVIQRIDFSKSNIIAHILNLAIINSKLVAMKNIEKGEWSSGMIPRLGLFPNIKIRGGPGFNSPFAPTFSLSLTIFW